MASARYTLNIKPEDLKPDAPRQLTKKEKAANWWHYHRVHLAAAALGLVMVGWLAADLLNKENPDYQIGLITQQAIPQQVLTELGDALSPLGQDLNGDGSVLVRVAGYQVDLGAFDPDAPLVAEADPSSAGANSASADSQAQFGGVQDAYARMAGVTVLSSDLADGTSLVFLTDCPEQVQQAMGILAREDGSLAPEDDLSAVALYPFDACPALAQLPLSEETRAWLADFCIARRGFDPGREPEKFAAENEAFFLALVADAPLA